MHVIPKLTDIIACISTLCAWLVGISELRSYFFVSRVEDLMMHKQSLCDFIWLVNREVFNQPTTEILRENRDAEDDDYDEQMNIIF